MSGFVCMMEDNGGVYINFGILNWVFVLFVCDFGGNVWECVGMVWYWVLIGGLFDIVMFIEFVDVMVFVVEFVDCVMVVVV